MKIDGTRMIGFGAVVALCGIFLSGPFSFLIVQLVDPQPQWVSSSVFAAHYSAWQNLPYYFGFEIKWLLRAAGLISYFLWNVLMIVLMILTCRFSKAAVGAVIKT
jgi:hypothetical protein